MARLNEDRSLSEVSNLEPLARIGVEELTTL
jgi:hypothetical protein